MTELTQDYLNELFILDRDTGKLYNRSDRIGTAGANFEAGTQRRKDKRWSIQINGIRYLRSRLVYMMVYGYMPEQVDHIDRVQWNDRPDNLRAATHSQNMANRGPWNKQGHPKGVYQRGNSYQAQVRVDKKLHCLGSYPTAAQAGRVAQAFRIKHFGEFATCYE